MIFRSPKITDAGLRSLATLTKLERLHVQAPNVSDAGIAELAEIETLEDLGVEDAQITDAALEPLGRLPNLERLVLDAGVSEAAAAQFAAAHPQCEVRLNVGGSYRWIAPAAATDDAAAPSEVEAEIAAP